MAQPRAARKEETDRAKAPHPAGQQRVVVSFVPGTARRDPGGSVTEVIPVWFAPVFKTGVGLSEKEDGEARVRAGAR